MSALLCGAACAFTLAVLPPLEYDKPYSGPGELYITRAASKAELRLRCKFTTPGLDLGCAWLKSDHCEVIMAPDEDIYTAGFVPSIVYRHERGHCNKWSKDHPGSRVATKKDWQQPLERFYPTPTSPSM